MNPQPAVKPNAAAVVEVKVVEHTKLAYVSFVTPIQFGGTSSGLRIGVNVDSVEPACFETGGRFSNPGPDGRGDGLLVRRTFHNRVSGRRETTQAFVPWSNVAEIGYGSAD